MDHLAIAAEDADKLVDWYADTLGYEKTFRMEEKPVWLITAPGGTVLEIMPRDETARPARTVFSPGLSHLALRVKNMAEAIAALDAKGVKWLGETGNAVGGGKVRSFSDPEGNVLQIVER
jgi:glyoxylase I family protein